MKATATNGDIWTGERQDGYWLYRDTHGNIYESTEVPAYRILADNATLVLTHDGKMAIAPIKYRSEQKAGAQ